MYQTLYNCVRGTRTQPLICAGCSVHYWESCAINEGGFFVVVDTHLPRFEALAYVLPHFDELTHVVIRASSAFIIQAFAEVFYSVFVKSSSFESSKVDPGGGLRGLQPPPPLHPLGSFQTCLATHVYPFFTPKIIL